jgi:two-component system, OmpR family, phosphate regulon sensor histidine kinase PhoR
MQRIVDDLLDLSRYESNAWTPRPVDVDLAEAIAELLGPLRDDAAARHIALVVDIAPDASTVRVDPTALRQILSNLLENAMRYTAAGQVAIRTSRSADGVTISVEDTGVGIAAEHLPRIFERFYRADPGRSRADGGTGLGLAIVRHLVEAHGGRVWAESEVGAGTRVHVKLP